MRTHPQNRLFTRNSATSMPGMGLDVAATFFPKICGGLSATSRLMLGMGFRKTLRRCGKFKGGDGVSFGSRPKKQ